MRKFACFILVLSLLIPAPVFAGSMTANGYFYKPSYGEKGPAGYSYYNTALDATDVVLKAMHDGFNALAAWASTDNVVTLITVAPTYVDGDTFTLTGDYTSRFSAGKVVQAQVAAGMVYSTVASSSYAAPTTTVNLTDAVLTDPITRVYVVTTRDGLWPNGPGYVVSRDYGTDRAALEAADAVAVLAGKELRITYPHAVDDDVTLAAPKVTIQPDAVLAISTAKTLTISNAANIGRYSVFNCAGTGKVAFSSQAIVLPEWWGAVANNSTDCAAAIQLAHDSLPATRGGVIDFGTGVYVVTPGTIVISTPGTVLQGRAAANDGAGTVAGTTLKAIAAGTGKMVAFLGAAAATPLDSCQINDLSLWGNEETVQGLSLKWVSNFRSKNLWVNECFDDGVYLEQVWDSSFYDLEIESCGAQGTGKVGLHVYNGAVDNCNNLRFFAFHAEGNYGDDVWIDSTAAGTGGNYNILFQGGKCEKSQEVGAYSTKAFKISGWDGATGKPNQAITIRDFGIFQYMVAGDIGIHFAGDGFMTVDNCFFANNTDNGIGIKVEGPMVGPYTHRLTNNRFTKVAQEITITTATCPRNRVWTDGNVNTLYSETDSRININSDLVQDRRPMVLATSATTTETSGTGEDILASTTVPAGLLSTFGGLKIHAGGDVSGAAGNKTIKFYWGSEVVTVYPAAALGDKWQLEVTIRNGTAGAQWLDWKMTVMDSPIAVTAGVVYPTQDTTADVVVKITGECADGADIIYLGAWRVAEE